MYIKNCRNNSNNKHFSPIKLCGELKDMSFEIGNFSFTYRYSNIY